MGERMRPITEYTEKNKRIEMVNWIAIAILMVFYMGTWLSPFFYHITEIYNTSIVFVALAILFFNNVNIIEAIRTRDLAFFVLILGGVIALLNLFIVGSHKGCILILADFLLVWYLSTHVKFTKLQMEVMGLCFLFVFLVWGGIDLAFSYNSNTGATVTVFTFFAAMIFITRLSAKREIYGLMVVIAVVRVVNLVLWHLARGAFLALFLFLFFYYVVPRRWWLNKKLYTFLSLFVTLGSLLFVVSYVGLAATGINFKMPFFYKSLFSGREQIWLEVWGLLKHKLITGIGSGFELESFFEYNMHNVMYDILVVHGVVVFIATVILITMRLLSMRNMFINSEGESFRIKILAASALFAIFLESFIDMDLMWADYTPLLLFLLLVIFADNGRTSNNNGKERGRA